MNNKTLIEQIEFIKTFLDEGLRRQPQKPSRWEVVKGKVGQVVRRIKRATVHDKVETNRNITDHEKAKERERHKEIDAKYKKSLDQRGIFPSGDINPETMEKRILNRRRKP